ncbi:hypothetical protein, partial [Herbaspirillum sp.]|uniref:hypothetical protein n=1 Tax=Herbaspirillum sp. TaxID=1890675 RepID=UPI00258307CB
SGEICANAIGGSGNYSYSWTGPGGFTSDMACITVSVAGDYCVVVTDANTDCVSVEECGTLTVTPNPPCSITPPTTPICAGGQGVFSGPGGGNLVYAWSTTCGTIVGPDDQQNVTIDFGAAGDCTVSLIVTVPGNPPCQTSCEIPVTINENPAADPNDETICEGESAEICANATGGSGNYTYSWTGPGGFTSDEACITVSDAGDYCVVVTDADTGCTSDEACGTLTVIANPPCSITPDSDDPVCAGDTRTYTGPGGANIVYAWSTDCGAIDGPDDQQSVTILFGDAGNCTIGLTTTIADTTCTSTCSLPVEVNEIPEADPNDVTVCEGDSGEICANAIGGSGNYSYSWTGPGGFTSDMACITVSVAGDYCVVVTDA